MKTLCVIPKTFAFRRLPLAVYRMFKVSVDLSIIVLRIALQYTFNNCMRHFMYLGPPQIHISFHRSAFFAIVRLLNLFERRLLGWLFWDGHFLLFLFPGELDEFVPHPLSLRPFLVQMLSLCCGAFLAGSTFTSLMVYCCWWKCCLVLWLHLDLPLPRGRQTAFVSKITGNRMKVLEWNLQELLDNEARDKLNKLGNVCRFQRHFHLYSLEDQSWG